MNATHALGWALVHFVWQGAALAVLLALALAVTRQTAARTRYALSLLTLAAMLVLPVATGLRLYESALIESPTGPFASEVALSEPETRSSVPDSPAPSATYTRTSTVDQPVAKTARFTAIRDLMNPALPWLVVLWVAGVVALSVRLGHGWIMARRLRIDGTRATSASLQQALERLAARMRVSRPVQLLESLLVEVPAVIGWLRPVILVPASALTGLTPQQLEVLLAHELAHVHRHDYLVNVIQCVIETLLFYHPAVWWVSRRVRDEREHCCDDLVVRLCGDRHLYASALVDMERLRPATPRLALAATGGSLLNRVKRLIRPAAAPTELFPRWAAGVAGVLAVTVALLATGSDRLAGEPAQLASSDTTRMAPDTVLRHPDPSQPLAQRWEWARTQARQMGRRSYWIGYHIGRPEWLAHTVYIDRGLEVVGQNIRMTGSLIGDFHGLTFRGVRLSPLVGTTDSDDIAILFGVTEQGGRVAPTHVHIASIYLPMDFRGRTLVWLGPAADAQSLPLVEGLFASTANPELREDVVAAIGIHGSSDIVVPILLRWLNGREPTGVRSQATEWLGFHPTATAVAALSRAARSDPAGDVRREAAEALGDNTFPAATDSTIAVARTATDPDARREAVEGLGEKTEDRARAALVALAQNDRDEDVQREAVETLGENLPAADAIPVLKAIATGDPNPDVQREAVQTLGELKESPDAQAAITEFARTHPNSDVRRAAIETLGELAPTAETVRLLAGIVANDRNEDVQRTAVETLGGIGEPGLPAVIDLARTHSSPDVRRAAVETVAEHAPAAQALELLAQIARRDANPDVQRSAVETLGQLHDDRADHLLVEFARTHPVSDVRRAAIETYTEAASPDSALALLKSILASEAPEDVYSKVLESLEELERGAGIPALIDAARSHPNREVRADALRRLAESDDPRAQQIFEQTLRRP